MILFIQQRKQYPIIVFHHSFSFKSYFIIYCLVLPTPLPIIIEDYYHENQLNKSIDISQSSQLTNDQNDTQSLISSATNEKEITPTRISYRMNPDGTRVSISRPPLPTNHQLVPPSLRLVKIK